MLVVGHDPSYLHTTMPRPALAEIDFAANEVADFLGHSWTVRLGHDPASTRRAAKS